MLMLAGIFTYELRFQPFVVGFRPVLFRLEFLDYLVLLSSINLIWIIIFAFSGLYSTLGHKTLINEIHRVVLACSTGFAFITIFIFFRGELFHSRFLVLIGFAISVVTVSLGRGLIRYFYRSLLRRGIGLDSVIILGDNHISEILATTITNKPEFGYKLVTQIHLIDITTINDLEKLYQKKRFDRVLIASSHIDEHIRIALLDFVNDRHIILQYAANLLDTVSTKNLEINIIDNIPVIEIKRTSLDGWFKIIKRATDLTLASLGVALLAIPMLIVAIIVAIDSKGPILYTQIRIGPKGPFKIYKFRSMQTQYCVGENYGGEFADKFQTNLINDPSKNIRNGILPKYINDPRWTSVGKMIRNTSIDELPQLFNVLRGDMSLVGPRPHLPKEVSKYTRIHKRLLAIKPGITGLSQISGRSDLDFDEEVRLDTYYIENWSFLLDLSILAKTPFVLLKKRTSA
jgi:exopolysaccharide biosynthesis polyprenyl glycosylphosphotransferase